MFNKGRSASSCAFNSGRLSGTPERAWFKAVAPLTAALDVGVEPPAERASNSAIPFWASSSLDLRSAMAAFSAAIRSWHSAMVAS